MSTSLPNVLPFPTPLPPQALPRPSKLLVCDDEPDSVALLISYLAEQEIDIRVALDGVDAINKAVSGQPDLILLDIGMPGLDGFSTCERLKSNIETARIPVLFLSGRNGLEDRLRGFAVGGVDFIAKPFSAAEVQARIGVHLNARQQVDELSRLVTLRGQWLKLSDGPREKAVARAMSLLEANLAEPPNLVDLAHQVGTNARNLTRIFRHFVGMTVFDFLSQRRLEVARQLVDEGGLQIRQISDRVGYRNPGDLTRAFRRHFGVAPRDYRRRAGQATVQPE